MQRRRVSDMDYQMHDALAMLRRECNAPCRRQGPTLATRLCPRRRRRPGYPLLSTAAVQPRSALA